MLAEKNICKKWPKLPLISGKLILIRLWLYGYYRLSAGTETGYSAANTENFVVETG